MTNVSTQADLAFNCTLGGMVDCLIDLHEDAWQRVLAAMGLIRALSGENVKPSRAGCKHYDIHGDRERGEG